MPADTPLFFVDADAFLSAKDGVAPPAKASPAKTSDTAVSQGAAAIRAQLDGYHADWIAGNDHAPPWRIMRGGFGFEVMPIRAPDVTDGYHLLPGVVGGERALSVTLDNHTIAGAASPTILRLLSAFAIDLAAAMGSGWMGWGPARIAYPPSYLADQMTPWDHNGLIPLLAFLRFAVDDGDAKTDGGAQKNTAISTHGMAFFRLPEVDFIAVAAAEHPPMHRADSIRRILRLAYALIADAKAVADGDFVGLVEGETLSLRWRRGGPFGRIAVTSRMRGYDFTAIDALIEQTWAGSAPVSR